MAAPPRVVEPPFYAEPIVDYPSGQQHSQAWTEYHQSVADRLTALHAGSTDGSDATAGDVGEFMQAAGSASLANGIPHDVASLTLTAGDWDVSGSAGINPSLVTMTFAQAWVSTVANTPGDPGRAGVQAQSTTAGVLGSVSFGIVPVRFNSASSVTVHLGCQANFPGTTTVTASVYIRARRAR